MGGKLSKIKRMKCEVCGYEFVIAATAAPPMYCPKCNGKLLVKSIEDSMAK